MSSIRDKIANALDVLIDKHLESSLTRTGNDGVVMKTPGGKRKPGRFARGGKVKSPTTNIAIVVPKSETPAGGPAGAGAPPPMPVPAPPPPGAGAPPPGMPPGMPPPPMRASGGRIGGDASKKNLDKWSKRASSNSYARGGGLPTAGADSGVGRKQLSHIQAKK